MTKPRSKTNPTATTFGLPPPIFAIPSQADQTPEQTLAAMRELVSRFYWTAFRIHNHAFLEFAGVMGEYVNACESAHRRGEDFRMANVHSDHHVPLADYQRAYLDEKLSCIFGMGLAKDPPR